MRPLVHYGNAEFSDKTVEQALVKPSFVPSTTPFERVMVSVYATGRHHVRWSLSYTGCDSEAKTVHLLDEVLEIP